MKLAVILSSMFLVCSMHAQSVQQLQSEIVQLQKQVAALQANKALALAPFVTVDPNPENGVRRPNIVFTGVNIHVVSGSGTTNDNGSPTGLGNLIIGYDESPLNIALPSGGRGGSHNLVIGRWNQFTVNGFGNLVAGEANASSGEAGLIAGYYNTVSGTVTSVLGGVDNWASGQYTVVCGGGYDWTTNVASVVLGGYDNKENAAYSVIVGGYGNNDNSTTMYNVTQ